MLQNKLSSEYYSTERQASERSAKARVDGCTLEVGGVTSVFGTGVNVAEKLVHDLVEPRERFRLQGLSPTPQTRRYGLSVPGI